MRLTILALALVAAGTLTLQAPAAAQQQVAAEVERSSSAELMAEGMRDGRFAAEREGTGGYAAGGFVGGFALGLIGTGIAYAVASGSDASLSGTDLLVANERGITYTQGYEQGFRERLRQRRKSTALAGGLMGTALVVALVLTSS